MSKKKRKIIFFLFIIAFFIISFFTVSYAIGYRFNFTWPPRLNQFLQKTGMINIETKPEGAMVYFDNNPKKNFINNLLDKNNYIKTPAKIKNVLPGEYKIKLKKDGYWEWEKRITVKPGKFTHLENIKLFKNTLPLKIINARSENNYSSPDKEYVLLPRDNIIFNMKDNLRIEFATSTFSSKYIKWSPDSEKVLTENKLIFIDEPRNIITIKNAVNTENFSNLKWDKNGEGFYYQDQKNLNYYSLKEKKSKKILSGEFSDYFIQNDFVFILKPKNLNENKPLNYQTVLEIFSEKEQKTIKTIELPYSPDYEIKTIQNDLINIYDNRYNILYLINPFNPFTPTKAILENVKEFNWNEANKLLYTTGHEIWTWDPKNNEKKLITRLTSSIEKVLWHNSNNYIIYSTPNSINVIESDKKIKRSLTRLIKLEKIQDPFWGPEDSIIYFNGSVGKQKGLYKLEL